MANDPISSIIKDVGDVVRHTATKVNNAFNDIKDNLDNPTGFMKDVRSVNLPTDAMPVFKSHTGATVKIPKGDNDWRVSLSITPIMQNMPMDLLGPLAKTDGKMVFPFTPSIIFSHSASYNAMQPTHTNYPFFNYQSSAVDAITIAGDFFAENAEDARYWVAAVTYLRTVTKMFYGNSENTGNPPPIVKLNGYGEFVFNDVPCVVTAFNIDLPQDVDYIKTSDVTTTPGNHHNDPTSVSGPGTWVPAQSLISVTVQPIYSRAKQAEFNLNNFVSGDLITKGMI
jgi:hypothetical protein